MNDLTRAAVEALKAAGYGDYFSTRRLEIMAAIVLKDAAPKIRAQTLRGAADFLREGIPSTRGGVAYVLASYADELDRRAQMNEGGTT